MYNVRTPNGHLFQRSGISPSLLLSLHWYWFWFTQCETEEEVLGRDTGWVWGFCVFAAFRLLHDADAAVELTLGVVVVDVGVAAAHVGRGHRGQAAAVVGTAVLDQYICALLTPSSPSVGQRRLTASVATFHIHAVPDEQLCDDYIGHSAGEVQSGASVSVPVGLINLLLGAVGQQHHHQPQIILHHRPK